jgi:hypothetical protein
LHSYQGRSFGNLATRDDSVQLDAQNLEMLRSHRVSLGGISANADFVDLEEDDLDVPCGDVNRIFCLGEIVV